MKRLFLPLLALSVILASCDDTTEGVGSSISDINDNISVSAKVFDIASETVIIDSVISRSGTGYLGKIKDPETGAYITGNYMTQFRPLDNYEYPEISKIVSLDKDKQPIADSCEVILFYANQYGDSTASMKCTLNEMARPMSEKETYYSSFSPRKNGYIRENGLQKSVTYSLIDFSMSESDRNDEAYKHINIALNQPYIDKDGKTYNNYGTYVMRKYYENPKYFANAISFINNVCPGFFIESTNGVGAMANIAITQLNIYFKYLGQKKDSTSVKDTVYVGMSSFSGTEEVMQKTQIVQDHSILESLASDKSCTYLKTPSGLFTKLTLPVDEVEKDHELDTLNTARVFIPRLNNSSLKDYELPIPQTLLILPVYEYSSFFENKEVADYRKSFLTTYDSSTNGYKFGNIASMLTYMSNKKKSYMTAHPGTTDAEYERLFPDWNKAIIIPVEINYTTVSGQSVLTRVTHDMSLTSTRLVSGSTKDSNIKMSVIYSTFKK